MIPYLLLCSGIFAIMVLLNRRERAPCKIGVAFRQPLVNSCLSFCKKWDFCTKFSIVFLLHVFLSRLQNELEFEGFCFLKGKYKVSLYKVIRVGHTSSTGAALSLFFCIRSIQRVTSRKQDRQGYLSLVQLFPRGRGRFVVYCAAIRKQYTIFRRQP